MPGKFAGVRVQLWRNNPADSGHIGGIKTQSTQSVRPGVSGKVATAVGGYSVIHAGARIGVGAVERDSTGSVRPGVTF